MQSGYYLAETYAQSLEWDGKRYTMNGESERGTTDRMRLLIARYLDEVEGMDEQSLFDAANWALEVEREELRLLAICNKRYGNVISFDGAYPDVVEEYLWELYGGFLAGFSRSAQLEKWPSWDDGRLYRWAGKVLP